MDSKFTKLDDKFTKIDSKTVELHVFYRALDVRINVLSNHVIRAGTKDEMIKSEIIDDIEEAES